MGASKKDLSKYFAKLSSNAWWETSWENMNTLRRRRWKTEQCRENKSAPFTIPTNHTDDKRPHFSAKVNTTDFSCPDANLSWYCVQPLGSIMTGSPLVGFVSTALDFDDLLSGEPPNTKCEPHLLEGTSKMGRSPWWNALGILDFTDSNVIQWFNRYLVWGSAPFCVL